MNKEHLCISSCSPRRRIPRFEGGYIQEVFSSHAAELTVEDLVQWTVVIEPEDEEDFDTLVDRPQLTIRVL
jgi:hypothetical protein